MRHIHWPQIHGSPGAEERERAGGEDFVSQLQGARVAARAAASWLLRKPQDGKYGSV